MHKRITVRLPTELLERARRKAAGEGRTLGTLVEDGLRYIVAEDRQRKPVRTSEATGGLMPGIDLIQMAKIYEIEDLEYIESMKRFK